MENSAPKAPPRARGVVAAFLSPEALNGPGVLALAAAGHVALVANARPQTLPALWELAMSNPLSAVACVVVVGLVSFQVSRLPQGRILLVRRMTIGLIAASLSLIAGDILNLIDVDQQPWAGIIAGATVVVLVGGLTTLMADMRALTDR